MLDDVEREDSTEAAPPPRPVPWTALLHRWFVQYNPLYLISAALVLFGVVALSDSMAHEGGLAGQLSITTIAEAYAWALIGSAALLTRIGLTRPAVMLGLLAALYQCDLTLQTERSVYLGFAGILGSALWLLSFVAKLRALAWAMRLQLSKSATVVSVLGGVTLALVPWLPWVVTLETASVLPGLLVFTMCAVALWVPPKIESRVRLSAWGATVARRSFRALWVGWTVALAAHIAFVVRSGPDLGGGIFVPVALVLATRFVRTEHRVWAWLVGTLVLVGVLMPEDLSITFVLVAIGFALRALRRPRFILPADPEGPDDPYRTAQDLETPKPRGRWVFGPSSRPAMARLAAAAFTCLYLALWTRGWSGGTWPSHVLWLDASFVSTALIISWRTRSWNLVLPSLATALHLVVVRQWLPMPQSTTQWAVGSIGLGFALLVMGLLVSIRWRLAVVAMRGGSSDVLREPCRTYESS